MNLTQTDVCEKFYLRGVPVQFNERIQLKEKFIYQNSVMTARPYSSSVTNSSTYKKEKNALSVAKRPLSADTIYCNDKNDELYHISESTKFYENLSKHDINQVTNLPSSQILKSLLCETVERPWSEKTRLKNVSTICASSIESSDNSDKIHDIKMPEFTQRNMEAGILIPGIKSKPPLPEKTRKKLDNFHSDIRIPIDVADNNENDRFDLNINDKSFPEDFHENNDGFVNKVMNKVSVNLNDQCFLEDLDSEEDKFDNFQANSDEPSTELKDNKTSFKNWIQDSNSLILETKLYENQTDLELQNLHKHQDEFTENICNIEPLFDYNTNDKTNRETAEDTRKLTPKYTSKDSPSYAKSKTIESTDKSNKLLKNKSNKNHQITKNNIKPNNLAKKPSKSILKSNPKLKKSPSLENIAKPNQVSKKLNEKSEHQNLDDNVKSWMTASKAKHDSFLEFLNKLDDLENENGSESKEIIIQDSFFQNLPEHDRPASTCDEIASILEVLEKEDLKSQKNIESLKEILNNELSDGVNLKNYDRRSSSTSSLASSNFNDFLSYLDEVDENCVKTLKSAKDRIKQIPKLSSANTVNVDTIPKLEDLLNYSNVELAHYIVDISLRLKEKASGITVLQSELSKLRNLINMRTEEFENTLKSKIKTQKDDYEAVIKRHQKFIDQLIADKKTLNQQCEGLISEMKVLEDRYHTNTKVMQDRHKIELQKAKEMHMAAEKLKREKWIEGKTQRIKEMTVKSLEPELQNMTIRHQQEITDLRSLHKRELEELELRAARKTQQQCEVLRQQLTAEREATITHERDILRQRLEKLVESEEKSYQDQRRRLNAEHAAKLTECEEKINMLNNEKERAIEAIKLEFDDKLQTAIRRQKTELKNVRESSDLEFEVWKNNYKKQQSLKITEMEAQMRDMCKKERDREIEMVIERLETEASETKEQTEQAAENRLRRMKEKFEEEVKDLEKLVDEYKTKYSETKEKLLSHEDMVIEMKTTMKQLQAQLQQAKAVTDELSMDKNKMRQQIKEEFLSDISSLENEIKTLKSSKEEELQKIFAKVKVTVAHKDELLIELSQNNKNLQEKCTLLENLLEQQRKDYLIK